MLDDSGDLLIRPRAEPDGKTAGVVLDDTTVQDAAVVLGLNRGEWKEDPALGPDLIRFIRSNANRERIRRQMEIHLKRAGLDMNELADKIQILIKNEESNQAINY